MNATTTSRRAMLDRIRTRTLRSEPMPRIDLTRMTTYADPVNKFVEMLGFVGGQAHVVECADDIAEKLNGIEVFRTARRIVSLVPEAIAGGVDANGLTIRMVSLPLIGSSRRVNLWSQKMVRFGLRPFA